jgi:hypothetical protein
VTVLIDGGTTRYAASVSRRRPAYPACAECLLPRPPGARHCAHCGICHLRADHHCVALGRCIALRNRQPFVVLLHWAALCAGVDAALAARAAASARPPARARLRWIAAALALCAGALAALLRAQMERMRSADGGLARALGDGWGRRWCPRIRQIQGGEWEPQL